MTAAIVPMSVMAEGEETVDITSYQLDLSDKFNYSNWGIEGETVTTDTFENAAKGGLVFADDSSMKDSFVLNDEMTFTFDAATASANVNNFYRAAANETAVFEGHESFVKTVYMGVTLYTNSTATISPVITYTDGTVDTPTIIIKNKAQIVSGSEPENYVGCIDATQTTMGNLGWRYAMNENGTIVQSASSDGLPFYAIDVDETKTIESIKIANTDSYQVAYYAIGGTVMSNAELLEHIGTAEEYDEVTDENKYAVITAKAYADELIERNAASESDFEKIYTLYNSIGDNEEVPTEAPSEDNGAVYQLDLSDKFNYSNWGIEGETVTTDTFEDAAKGGFIFADANSMKNSFAVNDEMTFTFDTATASANVNNFYRAADDETAVFTGHAPYAKTVYMGVTLYTNSTATISPVITYTDGTTVVKTITVKNKAQIVSGSEPENYVGCIDASKTDFGNIGWRYAKNENGTIVQSASSDGLPFYAIDVDETKIIESIKIANTDSYQVAYYAVGGTVMSDNELLTYVKTVEAYDSVSADNADSIITAKGYADELVRRNVLTEGGIEKINSLYEEVSWYMEKIDGGQNAVNLSDTVNMDMLAPVDSVVDNYFDPGFECTYTDMWQKITAEDIINAELDDGSTVKFEMNPDKYNAGVKDAVYLTAGGDDITVQSNGVPAEKVYFLWGSRGDNRQVNVNVTYSDGSEENGVVAVYRYVSKANDTGKVGSISFNWNTYYPVESAEAGKYIITSKSATAGINVYCMELDSTKTPVSYTFTPADYDTAIFAMTEETMSNADMTAVIESAKEIDLVRTDDDAELVNKAWAYAQELDRRHAVRLEDNAELEMLVKQAAAEADINVDISALLDTDLIVKAGDSRPSGYNGRDDALIKAMGDTITLISPRDANYIDKDSDRSFKLSGGYDGNGNDSVMVAKNAVKFDMGGKLLTRISFLVDCIDTNVSKINGGTVKAVITYTDGTSEEIKAQLRRSDTWYTNQYGAFANVEYLHYDESTGLYAEGRLSVEDEGDKYSLLSNFGVDVNLAKNVESITLKGGDYKYYVLGITAVPYGNAALEENLSVFETVTGASDVNESNAQTALLGASSALELHARGYGLDSESLAVAREVYTAAVSYLSGDAQLSFEPNLTVENGSAVVYVTMKNTTSDNAPYVIIIAAYDDNNELVGIKAGETKTLNASTAASSDSLTLTTLPSGAVKYKAMVWDGLKTMKPYAVAEAE